MKTNEKTTLTVAIPAHNEEKNIKLLLENILVQKDKNFVLEKIIVIADGCSDGTCQIVSTMSKKNSKIQLFCDGQRTGKAFRLNQIYKLNESDVLITLDADIYLKNKNVFYWLLHALENPEIVLAGGNPRPLPGKTFIEKIAVTKDQWWYEARKDFNGGDNIYNSAGICFAFKKEFAKSISFPDCIINDQEFIYLQAKLQGKKFMLAKNAVIYMREPASFKEIILRSQRFEYFDDLSECGIKKEEIEAYYKIPILVKLKGIMRVFLKSPFYLIASLIFAAILKIPFFSKGGKYFFSSGLWEISTSTKKLF